MFSWYLWSYCISPFISKLLFSPAMGVHSSTIRVLVISLFGGQPWLIREAGYCGEKSPHTRVCKHVPTAPQPPRLSSRLLSLLQIPSPVWNLFVLVSDSCENVLLKPLCPMLASWLHILPQASSASLSASGPRVPTLTRNLALLSLEGRSDMGPGSLKGI